MSSSLSIVSSSLSRDHIIGERCYLIDIKTRKIMDIFPSRGMGNTAIRLRYEKVFKGTENDGVYYSVVQDLLHEYV